MSSPAIVPIVEGHGEVEAVPILVRRIFTEFRPAIVPQTLPAVRVKAGSFLQDSSYFRKYVTLAANKAAQYQGLVLVILDSEDLCPAEVGPQLLADAKRVRSDVRYAIALASREYETWFLTAAASLRGLAGLSDALIPPPNPESIRGAKEWLSQGMKGSKKYDPIIHQAEFTRLFDMSLARLNPSFERLVQRLIN